MKLPPIHPQLLLSIKILSTVLIGGAIALEGWNFYSQFAHHPLPSLLQPLQWLGRIALVSHLIEGIIAGVYTASSKKTALQAGVYTFFTGTLGLLELWGDRPTSFSQD